MRGHYSLEMVESRQPEDAAGATTEEPMKPAGRFRTALPQVLASTAKNMILLDLGMTVAFPTIVIPALHNTNDLLALNDEQTSWFGSIMYICQPVGSVLSGIVLEQLGRKKSMILVNFPHVIGWFIFYFANSVPMLYISAVIMGLGVGFMEAPIITYVGEISQPELRGVLTSYAGIFVQLGFFLEYLIGTISTWRTAAAISAAVPIATVIAITQVPETPIWLLSRGRTADAEKALCWLRGWVPPINVKKEFDELVLYSKNMKKIKHKSLENGTISQEGKMDTQKSTGNAFMKKLHLLMKPQTLRPLLLVIMFFFFQHWSGFSGMRPYMVQVFDEFGLPLDAHWVTVVTGVIGMIGNLVCMVGVPWWGKRPISLVSMAVSSTCCVLLGGYAYAVISPGEVATASTRNVASWAPLTLFIALVFVQSVGVLPIPWMILSEVFPFKSRGLASGIAAAASYILAFLVSKTFLSIKSEFHLHGVFWLYGILGLVGFIVIYWTFSETEGRSLEEIEEFYKKGIRGKIPMKNSADENTKENIAHAGTNMSTFVKENEVTSERISIEEEKMINNALYEQNPPKHENGITNKAYSNDEKREEPSTSVETQDTSFTVSSGNLQNVKITTGVDVVKDPPESKNPKQTDSTRNEVDNVNEAKKADERAIANEKQDEKSGTTPEVTNSGDKAKGNDEEIKSSIEEKVDVHNEMDADERTQM